MTDPADFYTGIVAELYAPLKSYSQDPAPYASFVRQAGVPALELGCGDGDPLIELRRQGLDVEGVDSSADMLERCRRRAEAGGIPVVLHHQRMEALDLPRRYRAIFLAGPTFTLLNDDAAALAALRGIRAHLADGGSALIPLFVPPPTPADQLGQSRTVTTDDGAELTVRTVSVERDESARTQTTLLRYERRRDGESTAVDRPWQLHWYTRTGFTELAATAGLTPISITGPDGSAAPPDATSLHFHLRACG
ncbi:class I SAM-dependent methyltransferase [Kitasatospora kifunensis]|uniref:SAM-dependent methyltransferase n=1 Tax=Kitasatospora kifunensis TaxID=58351 RepID=A0A7W7R941_KITKI|nr:class I SAM-dependent methyltransferase [Kitasatospora kifunensis]MBB4927515.1 SAM-dependent methyltransferase [Kitasatospora kifunensis]